MQTNDNVRSRRKEKRVASKLCIYCNRIKPLNEFYTNKGWASQSFHDAWCRECAVKNSTDRESLQAYCWYNNRLWSDTLYDAAVKKARYSLANDPVYLDANAPEDKRTSVENKAIVRAFFSIMNLGNLYHYSPNVGEDGMHREFDPDSPEGNADKSVETEAEEQIYSKVWNGYYTQRELDYLDDYYARLEEGFVLDNQNIMDYARKAAKASLDADIKYNRMRQGQAGVAEWEKAQAIFDNLSKSANFAACRRKPGDIAGLGSLGAIVAKIEMSGELDTPMVEFPPDDIDKIIADFRHTVAAVGLEQVVV